MCNRSIALLAALVFVASQETRAATVSADEAYEIGVDAYTYAYPLVLMETSRRVMTNVTEPDPGGRAPMNQFPHRRSFPDASFTDVVRPNADTLYSSLWYDVSAEPLVIRVPDSGGRLNHTWRSGFGITVNTESTYDWEGHQWTVPINLFLSQVFSLGGQKFSVQAGGRHYAETAPLGPDWGLRRALVLLPPR